MEVEQSPHLPTSGEILGVIVKAMGFQDEALHERTARRYFSGRKGDQVQERSRWETLEAIVDTLANLGFHVQPQAGEEEYPASVLASVLDGHAVSWDRLRAVLLPRMMRIYPSNLQALWRAYLRLACIDLAVRVAALLHYTGSPVGALDFLEHASRQRRGEYLNRLRRKAGIPLLDFPDAAGVVKNTADAWLYHGARPLDENLVTLSDALSTGQGSAASDQIVRDLRLLYWVSGVAEVLAKHIGAEAVDDLMRHLHAYATQAYGIMGSGGEAAGEPTDAFELVLLGAHAPCSKALLTALAAREDDDVWKADLSAGAADWVRRIMEVNLDLHQGEVADLVHRTEGRILERWDIHSPQAYEHYQQSERLITQGRVQEAIAEVAKAVDLDPLDPVNHFTLGSALGGIGNTTGDERLIRRGMEACWLAHTLDPAWSLPWTEIGFLLIYLGKAEEAVAHLEGIAAGCGPLDARYHAALGTARSAAGAYRSALQAYEDSLALNPDDPVVAVGAAVAAALARDKLAQNRHAKAAGFLGAHVELDRGLRLAEAVATFAVTVAPGLMARAKTHFLRGEDDRAVAALDAAVALDAGNAGALMFRGIIYGYSGRHEQAVADLSAAITLRPSDALAHLCRGQSRGELDDLAQAIADFDEALRLDPGLVRALQGRGECRMYQGDSDAAIADFDAALALDPEGARSYRGRGAAHRMRGETTQAVADLDAALRLDPEDAYAYRFRGQAHLEGGDHALALADFEACLRRLPGDQAALRGRGSAFLMDARPDMAAADFEAILAANPESGTAHYGLGLAHQALGNDEKAAEDFRRARELGFEVT